MNNTLGYGSMFGGYGQHSKKTVSNNEAITKFDQLSSGLFPTTKNVNGVPINQAIPGLIIQERKKYLEQLKKPHNAAALLPMVQIKKPDPVIKNRKIKLKDNILNSYENYTYNLRVFLTRERATEDTLPTEDIIVLAESGSTATFSIQECNLTNIISPNFDTRNTLVTDVRLKIIEPLGSTFFDRIRLAAQSLGIKNHLRSPWWLEIKFKGYNGPGEDSSAAGDKFLQTETRLYKLTPTANTAEVSSSGTLYDIRLAPTNEVTLRDQYRRLPSIIRIDAETVGQFLEDLSKKLTGEETYTTANLEKNEWPAFNKIKFKTPKTSLSGNMRNWKLRANNDTKSSRYDAFLTKNERKKQDSKVKIFVKDNKTTVTFHKGTALEAVVEQILSSTIEAQSLAIFGKTTGSNDYKQYRTGRDPNVPAIIFIIDPLMEIVSYNNIANDYNTVMTYNIRQYKTFQPISSKEQLELTVDNKERLHTILSISNVQKHYEYIYTGLNTEIIDYKLTFDWAWFVQLPIFVGLDNAGQTTGTKLNSNNLNPKKTSNTKTFITQQLNQANSKDKLKNSNTPSPTPAQQALLNKINAKNITNITLLKSSKKLSGTSEFSSNNVLYTTNDITRFAKTKKTNQKVNIKVNSNASSQSIGTIYYAEDLDIISVGKTLKGRQKTTNAITEVRSALRAYVSPTESADQSNIESTSGPARTYFSAILNQVYHRISDMISITMEIRGDPYWLGEPNVEKKDIRPNRDLTSSQSLFLFTMAFPTFADALEEDSVAGTGIVNINRTQNGFNGIYHVYTVTSTFSSGVFTQKLDAYIDPLTQEQEIINAVNLFSPHNKK